MSWIKNTLLLFLLGLLAAGSVQKRFGFIQSKQLNGVFTVAPKPAFSCSTWMAGAYQDQYRVSYEDSVGFKPDLVRLFNQVDFSLFSIPHASKIVVGKENYLFADTYLNGYLGKDFIGKPFADDKINALKFLQDYLWKEKHILVLVVFTPAKGFYYPEFIPGRFLKSREEHTNYEYYLQRCREEGINYIDFSRWFLSMKDTSRYMLYPKTGIHWSSYGAFLCADSLRKYLEARLNRPLPRMVVDTIEISGDARDDDADMDQTLNKIWSIPHPSMAYPGFHFAYDSILPKPSALILGDSFYWYWYNKGIISNTFRNTEFWYYNYDVYPEHFTKPTNVGQIDYLAGILRQDVIILMQTNGGFGELGYGWIDMAYDLLYPGKSFTKDMEAQMRANPGWMNALEAKARERNVSTDHMMRLDAIFAKNHELRKLARHSVRK